jgi:hypothetical protein
MSKKECADDGLDLSAETRHTIKTIASLLFSVMPEWGDSIRRQAAEGVTYEEWAVSFQQFRERLERSGVFRRAEARGEDAQDLIKLMYYETRRLAGVEVKRAS